MSSKNKLSDVLSENTDDFEVVKSDQEDDGGFSRNDDETESFEIISSHKSTTVNHELYKDFETDENISELLLIYDSIIVNPTESYNYGFSLKNKSSDKIDITEKYNEKEIDIHKLIHIEENVLLIQDEIIMYKRIENFKKLVLNIYIDLFDCIFGYKLKTNNILEIISQLNQYFIDCKISSEKFPVIFLTCDLFYLDTVKYFETNFYNHIRELITNSNQDMIDSYICRIEGELYEKIFLGCSKSKISVKNYWGLQYCPIEDLSLIFNVEIKFSSRDCEKYYSIIK